MFGIFTSIVFSTTLGGKGGLKILTRSLFVVFEIEDENDVQYCCVRLSDILFIGSAVFIELFDVSTQKKLNFPT
jgi:hypothetical protein